MSFYPEGQFATFLTNHDQNRVMSQLRGDVEEAKMAAALLLTSPGVPFIYYGEEIGMEGQKPDERIRTPMQWDATPDTAGFTTGVPWETLSTGNEEGVNVAAQIDNPDSLLSHYRNLIQLRNQHAALRNGTLVPVESEGRGVYSFLRHTPDETLLVVFNLSRNSTDEYTLSLAAGPLSGTPTATVIFGEGEPTAPMLNADGGFDAYMPFPSLPAHSTTVIQLS
jgi:glycosidase